MEALFARLGVAIHKLLDAVSLDDDNRSEIHALSVELQQFEGSVGDMVNEAVAAKLDGAISTALAERDAAIAALTARIEVMEAGLKSLDAVFGGADTNVSDTNAGDTGGGSIAGGAGDDTITGGASGSDTVTGGDSTGGDGGGDTITGGTGNDSVTAAEPAAGDGNDSITTGADNVDEVTSEQVAGGGDGNDIVT